MSNITNGTNLTNSTIRDFAYGRTFVSAQLALVVYIHIYVFIFFFLNFLTLNIF